jgi:uncharacterized protein YqeY
MASELLQKILDDIKTAMKARDAETLGTLRTLHSDIKNVSINSGVEITDEIVLDVLAKSLKQKNEAIEMLKNGGREDKALEEAKAVELYQKYLPEPLSEDDVVALITELKETLGASSPKDMGKMMKELSPKVKGRFDSKRLSQLVQEALR